MSHPPIASLIPHGGAMRLLDAVVDRGPAWVLCAVAVREGAAFVRGGRVDGAVFIEYMAQAAAALLGLEAIAAQGDPRAGHLLAVREMTLAADHARVGDDLRVYARREDDDGTLARFAGEVRREGAVLARATLTVRRA